MPRSPINGSVQTGEIYGRLASTKSIFTNYGSLITNRRLVIDRVCYGGNIGTGCIFYYFYKHIQPSGYRVGGGISYWIGQASVRKPVESQTYPTIYTALQSSQIYRCDSSSLCVFANRWCLACSRRYVVGGYRSSSVSDWAIAAGISRSYPKFISISGS